MKSLHSFAIAIPLAAAMLFAQDPPNPSDQKKDPDQSDSQVKKSDKSRTTGQADAGSMKTYTGTIVDANCSSASALMGTDSSSASPDASKSTSKSAGAAKKEVLKQCQPTANTTSYALLTDDGHFLKFDSAGNTEVTSKLLAGSTMLKKNTKASVNGTVEGDTLKVASITKM
jgi:hypothetical protein